MLILPQTYEKSKIIPNSNEHFTTKKGLHTYSKVVLSQTSVLYASRQPSETEARALRDAAPDCRSLPPEEPRGSVHSPRLLALCRCLVPCLYGVGHNLLGRLIILMKCLALFIFVFLLLLAVVRSQNSRGCRRAPRIQTIHSTGEWGGAIQYS